LTGSSARIAIINELKDESSPVHQLELEEEMRDYFYKVRTQRSFSDGSIYLIVGFSEICKELQQVQAMLLEDYLEKTLQTIQKSLLPKSRRSILDRR
jgi:hypothetical protein